MPTYFRSDGWVKAVTGQAVPGAQVYVCTQPANVAFAPPTPLVSIFSDPSGLVPITQPILTDGFGHYDFYVLPGTYTVVVCIGNVIQQVYPDQSVGVAGGGGGTVSSVGLTDSTGIFSISNTPITTSGNIGIGFATEPANTALMGPTSGAAAAPTFRTFVVNDFNSGTNASNSTFWRGDGTWAIPATNFSTSGGIGMVGPGMIGLPYSTTSDQQVAIASNNEVRVVQFTVLATVTLTKCTFQISGGINGTKVAFGIYSSNGNTKLLDTGAMNVSGVPSTLTSTFGAVTLTAGVTYLFAQTSSNTGGSQGPAYFIGANEKIQMNTNANRYGVAANASAAGVLPSTLGPITPDISGSNSGPVSLPFFEP